MTLNELKKEGPETLLSRWIDAEFPFDMAICGHCVTTHGALGCAVKEHSKFVLEAKKFDDPDLIKENLSAIVKLRIRFKRFYNNPVPKGFIKRKKT